ncbi:MAG: hypothetical protein LBU18_00560 [Treponema sp.]|nr:hypothetical protein [Treponema sp.]
MKRIFYIALLAMLAAGSASAQQWGADRRGPGPMPGTRRYDERWDYGPGPGSRRDKLQDKRLNERREERRGTSRDNFLGEAVAVTGSLELIDGNIALRQDSVTYYVAGLDRLTGFIEGLKEGAEVSLEGTALKLPGEGERRILLPAKLVINGKAYENLTRKRAFPVKDDSGDL